jgi:hypothetical protein
MVREACGHDCLIKFYAISIFQVDSDSTSDFPSSVASSDDSDDATSSSKLRKSKHNLMKIKKAVFKKKLTSINFDFSYFIN